MPNGTSYEREMEKWSAELLITQDLISYLGQIQESAGGALTKLHGLPQMTRGDKRMFAAVQRAWAAVAALEHYADRQQNAAIEAEEELWAAYEAFKAARAAARTPK